MSYESDRDSAFAPVFALLILAALIFIGIRVLAYFGYKDARANPYHYRAAYCWPNGDKCQYQDYWGSQPTCPEYFTWPDSGTVVKLKPGSCEVSK